MIEEPTNLCTVVILRGGRIAARLLSSDVVSRPWLVYREDGGTAWQTWDQFVGDIIGPFHSGLNHPEPPLNTMIRDDRDLLWVHASNDIHDTHQWGLVGGDRWTTWDDLQARNPVEVTS